MVSDQEIASCVQSLLRHHGPGGAPINVDGVVQQLEAKLGLDLSHKAGFIRDEINLFLRPVPPVLHHHHHQQQQQHLQHQFLAAHPHQLLQHQQIPASPFIHLPSHHELAFQCAPAVGVQGHHLQQQQLAQPQQRSPAAGIGMVKQEGHLASGSAVAPVTKESLTNKGGCKQRQHPAHIAQAHQGRPHRPLGRQELQFFTQLEALYGRSSDRASMVFAAATISFSFYLSRTGPSLSLQLPRRSQLPPPSDSGRRSEAIVDSPQCDLSLRGSWVQWSLHLWGAPICHLSPTCRGGGVQFLLQQLLSVRVEGVGLPPGRIVQNPSTGDKIGGEAGVGVNSGSGGGRRRKMIAFFEGLMRQAV